MGLTKAAKKSMTVQKGQGSLTTADQVLGVDEGAFTPSNPGQFQIFRSAPVVKAERKFTIEEANALKAMAGKSEIQATASKDAFRALKKIKTSDTTVQVAFNGYRAHEAKKTLEQVESNAQAAKTINGLRAGYGLAYQAVAGSISAENAKQQAIFGAESKEKKKEFSKLW
jgi:hypothetical protein